jgi:hypothetical protein
MIQEGPHGACSSLHHPSRHALIQSYSHPNASYYTPFFYLNFEKGSFCSSLYSSLAILGCLDDEVHGLPRVPLEDLKLENVKMEGCMYARTRWLTGV